VDAVAAKLNAHSNVVRRSELRCTRWHHRAHRSLVVQRQQESTNCLEYSWAWASNKYSNDSNFIFPNSPSSFYERTCQHYCSLLPDCAIAGLLSANGLYYSFICFETVDDKVSHGNAYEFSHGQNVMPLYRPDKKITFWMIDPNFIVHKVQSGVIAKEKVLKYFADISLQQFNWKPSVKEWSMAQCLDHLIISDSAYFADLQKIIERKYTINVWQRLSPFTVLFGQFFKYQLDDQVKYKMTTHRTLIPKAIEYSLDFIDLYLKNLDTFLNYISVCREIDIDKIVITSPFIPIITYRLRDVIQFLIQHEHRHINQAIRVKDQLNFPKYSL
jgi:uncharacterized damage-inducible protein DinB